MSKSFPEVEKSINERLDNLKKELRKIRTGRANPSIIEEIMVDYFGVKQPVKSLGSISSLGPQTLTVSPWDKKALEPISSAITKSQNGLQAVVDGDKVRIPFPPLSEERREEFIKFTNKKAEETRVQLRQLRDDEMKELKNQKDKGDIGEDDFFRAKERLEKLFKDYDNAINEVVSAKEKELSTI